MSEIKNELEKKGIHTARIPYIDLAFWDVFLTLIGAVILTVISKQRNNIIYYLLTFIILIIVGIYTHKLFRIDTQLNRYLHI